MKYTVTSLLLIFGLGSCSKTDVIEDSVMMETDETSTVNELTKAQQYFLDVGLGQEFGGGDNTIKKWTNDINIYVHHNQQNDLMEEILSIVGEINDLSMNVQLSIQEEESLANYHIFLSDASTYAEFEPNASSFINENWGVFWLYWRSSSVIYKGSMYVDIERTTDFDCQKHLLREELTQSLGLMNDSYEFPQSIFQQNWTCTTHYLTIDEELIRIMLDTDIKPGMDKTELVDYFKSI